jgi:uncharacterized protein (TIGR00725 family)
VGDHHTVGDAPHRQLTFSCRPVPHGGDGDACVSPGGQPDKQLGVPPRMSMVAVIGDGILAEGSQPWRLAELLGERLVDAGYRVLTGGLGGVMEAASRGARRSVSYVPGLVIGLLPGDEPAAANAHVDVSIATGLGHLRNALIAHADAVVAIGGGAGTLSEIALAWMHRRLLLAYRVEGWSGRLAGTRVDDRVRFASIPDDRVFAIDTADEAVALLEQRLPEYAEARRHVH